MATIKEAIQEALQDVSNGYTHMTYSVTDGRFQGEVLLQDNCIVIAVYDYEANTECIYSDNVSLWQDYKIDSNFEGFINQVLFYNETPMSDI